MFSPEKIIYSFLNSSKKKSFVNLSWQKLFKEFFFTLYFQNHLLKHFYQRHQVTVCLGKNTSLEFFTNNTQRLTLDNNGALRNVNGARSDFYNGSYDARGLHVEGVGSDRRGCR